MSITLTPSLANPDPLTQNPSTLQGLVDILNPLFEDEVVDSSNTFVTSSSTPAVSDQNRAWLKTDSAGRPLGVFLFYNGSWRKFYNGSYGELKTFIGNPADFFDATGLGKIDTDWDGWAVCNGNNATPDLSDRFVVFAKNNTGIDGYASNWLSNVTGTLLNQGGDSNLTIQNNNLPSMKVQLSGKVGYDDNASAGSNHAIVTTKWYASGADRVIDLASFGADPNATPAVPQTAISTVPPYVAACPVLWVGYP